jgi:hypothetical protein
MTHHLPRKECFTDRLSESGGSAYGANEARGCPKIGPNFR